MLTSLKDSLAARPFAGISTSIGGYILSLADFISPFLRFLILLFSTITAISVAYVHYTKARRTWYGKEDTGKKGNSNTR